VLVVSTDPAHSLSDALGLELIAEPRPVRSLVQGEGELYAAELDADRALSRWLRDREDSIRTIADRGTYLDEEDVERFMSLSFPGVDELVGLVELMRLSRMREVDHVVVDTAPTGHTLRLLEMPDTLKRIAEVLDDMHAKHRFLASSLGGREWRPDKADEAIAEIEQEAKSLRDVLTSPKRASFTWVTLPEELPVKETEDGVRAIEELGIRVATIVINRVWPEPDRPCGLCTPRVIAEREWRERIVAAFGDDEDDKDILEAPAQEQEPRGISALHSFAMSLRHAERERAPKRRVSKKAAAAMASSRSAFVEDAPTMRLQGAASPIAKAVRLVLFGGKGGVGKTTAAAASAIELAEARRRDRVLLLSTDPAHSLGDVLDAEISDDRATIPGGPKNLFVRELDAARAWEAERERYRQAIDDLFSSIFSGKMDATFDRRVLEDLLDLAPPGIDELLALVTILDALIVPIAPLEEKLDEAAVDGEDDPLMQPITGDEPTVVVKSVASYISKKEREKKRAEEVERERQRFDLVVVDTAPTGHTLRLLALPGKALEWVHALMSVILKYRSVIGLGELATDLTTLARRLRALAKLLADPAETAFVIVTRPAELPRLETERLARDLRHLKIPVAAIVANAVTDPGCARCEEAHAREAPELERLERLAYRAARSPRLLAAPAIYPPPRGVLPLSLWRLTWRELGANASAPLSTRDLKT